MNRYMAVGLSVLAGAVLFEAALIPGIVIGGAAVLAPLYLPKLRRRPQPAFDPIVGPRIEPSAPPPDRRDIEKLPAAPAGFAIKQALAKTVTFRIIATGLDFSVNYVVIGEFAAAASLSAFGLIVGPFFYFVHETTWNYLRPPGNAVDLKSLPRAKRDTGGFAISRALAKTITFRAFATAMDFTTNFVVIGDLVTAAGLTGFAFVVGPFVYLGHEMAWDYYTAPGERTDELALPANLVTVTSAPAGGRR
jgi:uncharacterized membrane protein